MGSAVKAWPITKKEMRLSGNLQLNTSESLSHHEDHEGKIEQI